MVGGPGTGIMGGVSSWRFRCQGGQLSSGKGGRVGNIPVVKIEVIYFKGCLTLEL